MITANELLQQVKFRLREGKVVVWSNEALISTLNLSLQKIARDLLIFKKEAKYTVEKAKSFYELPKNKIKTIAVKLNGKIVQFKSFDAVMLMGNTSELFAYETQDGLFFSQEVKEGILSIAYAYSMSVENIDEILPVPDFAQEALLLYLMYLTCQREESPEDLTKKAVVYLKLYDDEIVKVKNAIKKMFSSKSLTMDYQRV